MILSGLEIAKEVGGKIKIEPYDPKNIGPNSYNLRLHDELLVYTEPMLDMKKANPTTAMRIPAEGMIF